MNSSSFKNSEFINSELFSIPTTNPGAKLYLVCFAYAGGSSAIYLPWLKKLHPIAELVVCRLPGRGARLLEDPYDRIELLIQDLCAAIRPLCNKPMVFFGHSLGSKLAYELCLIMQQQNLPLPVHFIASAAAAPFPRRRKAPIHNLPEPEFIRVLERLKGIPYQILSNPELMELCLPALRADFKLVETYVDSDRKAIDTQLTLMGGVRDDMVSAPELADWNKLFSHTTGIRWFEGDHLFINQNSFSVLQQINNIINTEALCQLGVGQYPL